MAEYVTGRPARSEATRAASLPCSASGMAQLRMTSTTSPGYTPQLLPANLRKLSGNNSHTFLNGYDLIDRNVRESIYNATRPGDFQGFNGLSLPQPEVNTWVLGGHVSHSALGLPVF